VARTAPPEVPTTASAEAEASSSAFFQEWTRSADAAAAAHQIRNRLQSIIIEAALLKRSPGGDPAGLARISALAQDGAGQLEIFGELITRPKLEGRSPLVEIKTIAFERSLEVDEGIDGISVALSSDALIVLVRQLVCKAAPFRGFQATRIRLGVVAEDRFELILELQPTDPTPSRSTVTPWLTGQQMARDVGGSLELHSGDPSIIKLRLPRG